MDRDKHANDIALAQKVCEELRAGNHESIYELYNLYNQNFFGFARVRLYNTDQAGDLLNSFWMELLNGKAICEYRGERGASLRTYLYTILYRRIIDANRKVEKERKRFVNIGNQAILDSKREETSLEKDPGIPTPQNEHGGGTQERTHLIRQIVSEAILRLSEFSPKDAQLIRMHLEGFTYDEMAERLIGAVDDRKKFKKKVNAIKKQFTRKRTGSKAKFRVLIERILETKGLKLEDL